MQECITRPPSRRQSLKFFGAARHVWAILFKTFEHFAKICKENSMLFTKQVHEKGCLFHVSKKLQKNMYGFRDPFKGTPVYKN